MIHYCGVTLYLSQWQDYKTVQYKTHCAKKSALSKNSSLNQSRAQIQVLVGGHKS